MGFIWTNFGVLSDSNEDTKYLYIFNENNDRRQISLSKYAPAIPGIKEKVNLLKGKSIQIRTSQNTGNWGADTWFSDLSLANTKVLDSGGDTSDETPNQVEEKVKELEIRLKEQEGLKNIAIKEANNEKGLRIHANEQAESLRTAFNELVDKYNTLDAEYEALSQKERGEIDQCEKELDKQNVIGQTIAFQCRGHAQRTLALRMGIKHHGRLDVKVLRKVKGNRFEVMLPFYNGQIDVLALCFDGRNFFIKTTEWRYPSMRDNLKAKGWSEADLKDNRKYSLDDLVEIHRELLTT